jgi:hypothetical protein
MLRANTYLKIAFGDWMYFLGYDVSPDARAEGAFSKEWFFVEAKKHRFRFEKKDVYAYEALHEQQFQYGNYHLAMLDLHEDFRECSAAEVAMQIKKALSVETAIDLREIEATFILLQSNSAALLSEMKTIYRLDLTGSKLKSKIAPFGMHSLFLSFIAFSKDGRRMVYMEIGTD